MYDPEQQTAVRRAMDQFRWFAGGWRVNAELPIAASFNAAATSVREQPTVPVPFRAPRQRLSGAQARTGTGLASSVTFSTGYTPVYDDSSGTHFVAPFPVWRIFSSTGSQEVLFSGSSVYIGPGILAIGEFFVSGTALCTAMSEIVDSVVLLISGPISLYNTADVLAEGLIVSAPITLEATSTIQLNLTEIDTANGVKLTSTPPAPRKYGLGADRGKPRRVVKPKLTPIPTQPALPKVFALHVLADRFGLPG